MKKITIIAAASMLFATASFAQDWNWDKAHSQLNFSIVHMGHQRYRRIFRLRYCKADFH
ncbi:hypothetical protein ACQ86N_23675 [Puia sp. P3]|uniref:hypothetical protein n=1 Tax=Puia sp. P3 TaxID=3423952 RepID=UPI003D66FED2